MSSAVSHLSHTELTVLLSRLESVGTPEHSECWVLSTPQPPATSGLINTYPVLPLPCPKLRASVRCTQSCLPVESAEGDEPPGGHD